MEREWLLGAWAAAVGTPQAQAEAEMLAWSKKWRENALASPVPPREDEGLREVVCTLAEIAEHDTNYPDRVTQKMARAALRRLDPSGTIRAKRPRDEPTPGGMTPGGKS